jgi:signal transduction histidine kinase
VKKNTSIVTGLLLWLSVATFAQPFNQQKADSLTQQLDRVGYTPERVDIFNQLARVYYDKDIKKSLTYGDSAHLLAFRLKYDDGIKASQNILQRVNQRMGIYSTAFEYTLNNLIRTEHDMDTTEMLDSYITLGNINSNMENYGEAQLYFHKALVLAQKSKSSQQANIMNYIGRAHGKLMRFDSAEHWIKQALEKELANPQPGATMAYIYNNLGEIYYYQKNYKQALQFYNQAAVLDSTKTNEYGRTYTLNGLAHVYHATGKETDAIAALEKSLTISVKNLYRDKTREAYGLLYQIYEARGEFKRAFDYYRQFVTYRDSVFNASLTQYIENQNISLENESLRRETELKDAALKQQRLFLWMVALAAILTVPLVFSLLYAYRVRTRSNNLLRNFNKDLTIKVNERTQELTKTNIELARHNNQLEEYQFITAHNLRGPVARILGLLNIVNSDSFQWPRDKNVIEKLTQASVDLDNIVHDLSHVLRVKRVGNSTYEQVFLSKRMLRIKSTLKDLILESGITFQEDYSQADSISTIPTYIESILYNLIANSIKFRSPDRKPVVTIKTFSSENQIAIHVSDNGLGIDLTMVRDKLYGLYQRFHTHVEGRGLGLYLVKAQVDAFNGSIEIESSPDMGTTFRIRFPRN